MLELVTKTLMQVMVLDSDASAGAAMAFLITGAGTSVGAVVGALTSSTRQDAATIHVTSCRKCARTGIVMKPGDMSEPKRQNACQT